MVNTNDIGKTLQLGSPTVIPRKYAQNGYPSVYPGTPKQIHFFAASEGDSYNDSSFTLYAGLAYDEGKAFLTVVYPGLTVTEVCDTNFFLYGSPITFHGSICNTGDVPVINITLTDTPTATISFAATTSSGRPFTPATGLTNGECVDFIGSYSPPNTGGTSLWEPFTDTLVASGQAYTVFQQPVYYATNSATCFVGLLLNPAVSESNFLVSFLTVSNHTNTLLFTDWLSPANWRPLTNFLGDGTTATIPAAITNAQQFYRVLVQ